MRFITAALCLLAIQLYIVLAAVPQPSSVDVSDLTEERKKTQLDDYLEWSITDQYSDPEHWEDECADGEHGHGHGPSEHGHGHGHGKDHRRKCSRVFPLSKKGPFQVSYEFEKSEIVPDLFAVAPTYYVEVRTQAIHIFFVKTMFLLFNGYLTNISSKG